MERGLSHKPLSIAPAEKQIPPRCNGADRSFLEVNIQLFTSQFHKKIFRKLQNLSVMHDEKYVRMHIV